MRSARSLAKLERMVHGRLERLRRLIGQVLQPGVDASIKDRVVGYAVIEAHNAWSNFVRSYLLSLVGAARTKSGARIVISNLSVQTPGDLLLVATRVAKGPYAAPPTTRRDEPAWHDISILSRTCNQIQPSNLAEVQAALGIQTRVFADLPPFRNFYAHRNQESAERVLRLAQTNYLITRVSTPTMALLSTYGQRPQPLILDWIDDISVVVDFLCI